MTSWLGCWIPDRAVWVQALARYCIVFLGKALYSHSASLHPGEYVGTKKCIDVGGGGDPMVD